MLTRGSKLGSIVNQMRSKNLYAEQMVKAKAELEKLGFCYNYTERNWTEKVFPSLQIHHQEFGHCIVKQDLKVPCCHPWPKKAWGMPLGREISSIRLGTQYQEQVSRDKAIVRAFAKVIKHGIVPQNFVVPSEDPWPRVAWTTRLGQILRDLRYKGTYLKYFGRDAEILDALGVNLRLSFLAWQHRIVPLLDIYANSHNDETIPDNFVISAEDPWPEEVWGVHLGLLMARNWHLQCAYT
ncbi:hypothetical protein PHMEG_0006616 [Phytophthora megakarya]|uniref:Uncharacterized protein n=1 Tax=Phytophthora megakarya TaxID=4795 RepID=A0A225WNG4_9STRA|nr:hypothetical protein PHMEG_0006616 [Phytophthora megakarya]